MELTCIMCPVGCTLTVTKKGKEIIVTGNSCPRGHEYGLKETTAPERVVTTIKQYKDGTICLKTSSPVPKGKVDDVLRAIKNEKEPQSIKVGDVYIKNILGLNSDIVVTEVNDWLFIKNHLIKL